VVVADGLATDDADVHYDVSNNYCSAINYHNRRKNNCLCRSFGVWFALSTQTARLPPGGHGTLADAGMGVPGGPNSPKLEGTAHGYEKQSASDTGRGDVSLKS